MPPYLSPCQEAGCYKQVQGGRTLCSQSTPQVVSGSSLQRCCGSWQSPLRRSSTRDFPAPMDPHIVILQMSAACGCDLASTSFRKVLKIRSSEPGMPSVKVAKSKVKASARAVSYACMYSRQSILFNMHIRMSTLHHLCQLFLSFKSL